MKTGELVQVNFGMASMGTTVGQGFAVGYVAALTSDYITLSQTMGIDSDGETNPNLISIPLGAILFSRMLEPGRKRSALPRQKTTPKKKKTMGRPAVKKTS